MKKRWKIIGIVCAIAILSGGCKHKESETPILPSTQDVPAETTETEYQPEPVETHEGEVRSLYTGEWMELQEKVGLFIPVIKAAKHRIICIQPEKI